MRRFVIGDIHGANKALVQCLDKSGFDYEQDVLISIGDVCDGWPETNQCFDTLLKINNLIITMGNHDHWTLEWALGNEINASWLRYGGKNTLDSYPDGIPDEHIRLLKDMKGYYEFEDRLFVHAGINVDLPISDQDNSVFLWDRNFFKEAYARAASQNKEPLTNYNEVYIGHTPIHRLGHFKPIKCSEVWMTDTGAGWGERLSIIDIDSKQVYQSDRVEELYPKGSGRI